MHGRDRPLSPAAAGLHAWAVRRGLDGAPAEQVFDGLCRRLVAAGVPLFRAFAGMRTLHPQWVGRSYTWQRAGGRAEPALFERGGDYEEAISASPFAGLIRTVESNPGLAAWPSLRRRLDRDPHDFAVLAELARLGATDYFAQLVGFARGDPARGTGIGYSFATDRADGFADADIALIEAVLPSVSLAIMAQAGHGIAAGLLGAYLGGDAARRVHAGAVERGSVRRIRAALWFADIRGFTALADAHPGLAVIEMLDEVFETLAAPLRPRGGEVLKFLGDGMLAIFAGEAASDAATCRRALDAAVEAMAALDRLAAARAAAAKPAAAVDLALHLGEVLYGNVGAVDRLDFTVIGPAVNEVSRIEALCDRLGRNLLVSAEFAAALGPGSGLVPLGRHALRGVREARAIYGVEPA